MATTARSAWAGRRDTGRSREDHGVLTAFVLLLLVGLFGLLGLVVDGGDVVTAHQAAEVEAEQAARAGAGSLDVAALRSGVVQIDPTGALRAAEAFSVAAGHPGNVTVEGGEVTVHISYTVPTVILGIVGVHELQVSAVASAIDLHGVTVGLP